MIVPDSLTQLIDVHPGTGCWTYRGVLHDDTTVRLLVAHITNTQDTGPCGATRGCCHPLHGLAGRRPTWTA